MKYKRFSFIGSIIGYIGASLWEPAFKKGYVDDYDRLTLFEKLGYRMFVTGLKMFGLTEEDLENLVRNYNVCYK